MYRVNLNRDARKFLDSLRQTDHDRVLRAVLELKLEPRPRGCLKMKGFPNQWRIRSGRYRIVYSIFDRELLIEVIDIDDRKNVYRD